jgi:eukaryotic-like serine/threonine-protein kinase
MTTGPDLPRSSQLSDYVLLERIGNGGMAEVFRAEKRSMGGFVRRVAVKRILPHLASNREFVRMFVDEARIAASLHHGNIVAIQDLGFIDGNLCLVMELIEGKPLNEVLARLAKQGRLLSLRHALFIALEMCKGLHAAHERRVNGALAPIIHRDVSPHNVLISFSGEVKISDFGVAKATERVSHTDANTVKGKISYMAPEVLSGESLDTRADLFAIGIVLHEMLVAKRLFEGPSFPDIIRQVTQGQIKPPSSVRRKLPPQIDAIVMKALARNPSERYQRVADLARDISQLLVAARLEATNAELGELMSNLFPHEAEQEHVRSAHDNKSPDQDSMNLLIAEINTGEHLRARPAAPRSPPPPPVADGVVLESRAPPDATARRTHLMSVVRELSSQVRDKTDMGLWLQIALLAKLALAPLSSEKGSAIIEGLVAAASGEVRGPQSTAK